MKKLFWMFIPVFLLACGIFSTPVEMPEAAPAATMIPGYTPLATYTPIGAVEVPAGQAPKPIFIPSAQVLNPTDCDIEIVEVSKIPASTFNGEVEFGEAVETDTLYIAKWDYTEIISFPVKEGYVLWFLHSPSEVTEIRNCDIYSYAESQGYQLAEPRSLIERGLITIQVNDEQDVPFSGPSG
ncbi:hypothetical protein ACFL1A_02040 [Patescibacteria group bacterium]